VSDNALSTCLVREPDVAEAHNRQASGRLVCQLSQAPPEER
jgi:hypothetical protein